MARKGISVKSGMSSDDDDDEWTANESAVSSLLPIALTLKVVLEPTKETDSIKSLALMKRSLLSTRDARGGIRITFIIFQANLTWCSMRKNRRSTVGDSPKPLYDGNLVWKYKIDRRDTWSDLCLAVNVFGLRLRI
ncbi:hypothetical protein ACJJTC_017090 [Scirpophaga incertulas]